MRRPDDGGATFDAPSALPDLDGGRTSAPNASAVLLADHPVTVTVPHERIGGMAAGHGRDAVAPGLLAGDAAVPVVVVQGEGIG